MVRQALRGGIGGRGGDERRTGGAVEGQGQRRREDGRFLLQSEDLRESRYGKPRRGEDVGAALALEKEGEPEGEGGAVRGLEGQDGALGVGDVSVSAR